MKILIFKDNKNVFMNMFISISIRVRFRFHAAVKFNFKSCVFLFIKSLSLSKTIIVIRADFNILIGCFQQRKLLETAKCEAEDTQALAVSMGGQNSGHHSNTTPSSGVTCD